MTRLASLITEGLARTAKTKSSLARELGISSQYISIIVGGKRVPRSPVLLDALARALATPPSKFTEAFLLDYMDREALLARKRKERYHDTQAQGPEGDTRPATKVDALPAPRPPKARRVKPPRSPRREAQA